MTCTHDPLTLTATIALLAFGLFLFAFAFWFGTCAAEAAWRRLSRTKKSDKP